MKKILAIVAVVAVLGIGSVASAHMYGWSGGYGYGGHMMGYGYGPMMGYGYSSGTDGEKYPDETADLRREFNTKRFEYFEALRTGDEKKAETIAKDLDELSDKIGAGAPNGRNFARGGYGTGGYCW